MSRDLPLAGTVVLLTGASRGIGRATAILMANLGADLFLTARDASRLDEVARACAPAGRRVVIAPCDLAGPGAAGDLARSAEASLGRVDILVNNAARIEPLGHAERLDLDAWSETLALNLTGPVGLIRSLLPGMLARGRGRIVNVSSVAATGAGTPCGVAYSASKAGLESVTRVLAPELEGRGVSIVTARPGPVDTAMQAAGRSIDRERVDPRLPKLFAKLQRDGRLRAPEEVARFLAAVCLDRSTGTLFDLDDPRSLAPLQERVRAAAPDHHEEMTHAGF